MKQFLRLFFILLLVLFGCATSQPQQSPTLLMSPEAKIQYYQEQITRYQYLIEQEKKKIENKK